MLRITSVSPGAVDYLLRGSDCAEHEHAGQGNGNVSEPVTHAIGYLLAGAEREPAGVWFGEGLAMVGVEPGALASEDQVRAVFGRLEHPSRLDRHGEPVALGSRPRLFRSPEERLAVALAAEPDATEERRAEIRNQAHVEKRKAVAYYDLTFSPVKSVSVYWATLLSKGCQVEAGNVVAAHRAGVAAAMAFVEQEAAQVRSGYHGRTALGESVGKYEPADGLVWIRWDHSTNRAQEPQLHSHVSVLNRSKTVSDEVVRALASRGFRPIKHGADAIYRRMYEEALTASNGVVFATRPDGKAREILGYSPQLLRGASTRNAEVATRRATLVQQFEQTHGRVPTEKEGQKLDRDAWRVTRQAKNHAVAPRQQIAAWVASRRRELDQALEVAGVSGERVARLGHPDQDGYAGRGRDQVLRAAVRTLQEQYATWDLGILIAAIEEEQRRTPTVTGKPDELAKQVLGHADRYGVVRLSPHDVGRVPAALRGPTGKSRYRPRNDGRYATNEQLRTETRIVARARATGSTALLEQMVLERVKVELAGAGLSDEQQGAVLQIVKSGRRGDVLIGPAGAGKSRIVGALARVWESHVGGRVLGVATSTIAANVLAADGLTALNSTRFRNLFTTEAGAQAHARIGPRDLVVVDEAGMSSTAELDQISALVWAAGAKLVYTGDHQQLSAVGAGGMLELLARDAGAIELSEIYRFTHDWERAASDKLRDGNPEALVDYDRHGRIRGGTAAEMTEAAVRGYVADMFAGRRAVLAVRDNDTAAALASRIRDHLVTAGRVDIEVLCIAGDGNPVSIGDLLQARRNDPTIPVEGPGEVTNREVYEVLGHNPLTRTLTVQTRDGVRAHLPDAYVGEHSTLAYAVTTYAAQGLTVDTSHVLVDPGTDRAGVYVPGTRGRDANTFYVTCQQDPGVHDPEPLERTPLGVLTDILTRPTDTTTAAELARRAGEEEGRSLAWVGTQWDLLTAEYAQKRATSTLHNLLGSDVARHATKEPGYLRLMSAVRSMELAGYDPDAVLGDAVARGRLHDATSVSDVLRYRVRLLDTSGRRPERVVRDGDWATLTAPLPGPVGDYIGVLAEAATARQIELGERAAADPPPWALSASTLGPPPTDPLQQVEWVRRAGIVGAYRDLNAIPDNQDSIGAAPSREREFHHALWRHAAAALGHPADALDYTTATTGELREMRDAWHRAQTWAPSYVADQLHQARIDAEEHRRDYLIWQAGADRHPLGSTERDLAEHDITGAQKLRAFAEARIELLEKVQEVRDDWIERTRELQQRGAFAGDELERRGLDRDTATPTGEQQELFTLTDVDSSNARPDEGNDVPRASAASYSSYAALTADAEQAMERDHHQPGLFKAQPAPYDVAAAQPLHLDPAHAQRGSASPKPSTGASTDVPDVTVDQAARQAAIVAALRAEFDARVDAAAAGRLRTPRTNSDRDEDEDIGYGYSNSQDESSGEQAGQEFGLST